MTMYIADKMSMRVWVDVPGDVSELILDGGVEGSCGVFFPGKLGGESHW